ncbi:MAG: Gfo/Idh/MocA family oxidoreductase [Verrucomicrobia bacterium]|nr:Gfo/Idh/MocA family oxidoreductase [Verrucomicrobiota bacterium]
MQPRAKQAPYQTPIHRRSFIKGILEAGACSIVASNPLLAQSRKGKATAGDKVRLACCGIGNRGKDVVLALHATGLCKIVALCDVDMGAPHTLEVLKKFPDAPQFQDFRKMLDKLGKDIDAVSIGVPDFAHFPIAMLAMSMGKHVYVEKPMAHTFQEVELMMQAERKYQVAAQMGNQGHSEGNYFQFKAWTEAGIIKNVTRITAFMNSGRRWHGMKVSGLLPAQPVPASLDWETWLGTAQFHAYNKGYTNGDWRSWFDFGNGALGDWGAHIFDTAHEFLKLGLPEEINSLKADGPNEFIFPQASTLCFKFPKRGPMPPVELTWYDGVKNLPPLPDQFGDAVVDPNIPPPTAGKIETKAMAQGKVIYGEGLTFKGGTHGATLQVIPEAKAKEMASKLPPVPPSPSNHFANFLLACQGQETCRSSFAVAGPLSQVMVLGVIAQRVNAQLKFDRATSQITNHPIANALLVGPPPRKEWEQFYKL